VPPLYGRDGGKRNWENPATEPWTIPDIRGGEIRERYRTPRPKLDKEWPLP